MQIITCKSFSELAQKAASLIQGPHVGLSGGSTFKNIFQIWQSNPNLAHFEYYPVDERKVPMTHPDSNWGMTRELFFDPLNISAQSNHLAESAIQFETLLKKKIGNTPLFNTLYLGMGEDGHTASLFPGDVSALSNTSDWVIETESTHHKHPRVSLTLRSIWHCHLLILIVTGETKANILQNILKDSNSQMPIKKALEGHPNPIILTDYPINL